MKIKNIVAVLFVTFILASCAPGAKIVPTETAVQASTFTPVLPTFTHVVPTPISTPVPPIETLAETQKSASQFASAMQIAGINITAEEILKKELEIQTITGTNGKEYEIAIAHLDPDPGQQGETLEGNYPLMIKTDKEWNRAILQNIAEIIGWQFGALLNLNADFYDITVENFGLGNAYISWNLTEPQKGIWDFSDPGWNVDEAHKHSFTVMANLIWGNNVADWARNDPDLKAVMEDYIIQVMAHYKGKVQMWSVYNEATYHGNDDIFWNQLGGIEAVRDAYRTARSVDSSASLLYNDYVDVDGTISRDRLPIIEQVVSQVQQDGNIDGIALQVITRADSFDPNKLRKNLDALSKYNLPIYIPEYSVLIQGENTPENLRKQAETAAEVIKVLREYKLVKGVVAFPLEDRIANMLYQKNSNSGLWYKDQNGKMIAKPIVYEMMKAMVEP